MTKKEIENYKEDPKTMTFMRLSRADSTSNAELKYADWKRMAKVRDGDILNQKKVNKQCPCYIALYDPLNSSAHGMLNTELLLKFFTPVQ